MIDETESQRDDVSLRKPLLGSRSPGATCCSHHRISGKLVELGFLPVLLELDSELHAGRGSGHCVQNEDELAAVG